MTCLSMYAITTAWQQRFSSRSSRKDHSQGSPTSLTISVTSFTRFKGHTSALSQRCAAFGRILTPGTKFIRNLWKNKTWRFKAHLSIIATEMVWSTRWSQFATLLSSVVAVESHITVTTSCFPTSTARFATTTLAALVKSKRVKIQT